MKKLKYVAWKLYQKKKIPYTETWVNEVIVVVVNTETHKIHSCWSSEDRALKLAKDLNRSVAA